MNFNIYLDERTGRRLAKVAARSKKSRNALIRQAVRDLLEREDRPQWPEIIRAFKGFPDLEPFESHRGHLRPPADDPFA